MHMYSSGKELEKNINPFQLHLYLAAVHSLRGGLMGGAKDIFRCRSVAMLA